MHLDPNWKSYHIKQLICLKNTSCLCAITVVDINHYTFYFLEKNNLFNF